MPYRLKPRYMESVTMEIDLVIAKGALDRIATPYMQMVLNFELQTITAPAPPPVLREYRPELQVRDSAFAQLSLENLARIFRQRSSSIQNAVRGAPKLPWNFPYPVGSRKGGARQPQWEGDERPFTKDVFDLGSNSDWVTNDFAARKAQIDEWLAAKIAREEALQTKIPDPDFVALDGLFHCDTYASDSDMAWHAENLGGIVMDDYKAAVKDKNMAAIRYQQAHKNFEAAKVHFVHRPAMVE